MTVKLVALGAAFVGMAAGIFILVKAIKAFPKIESTIDVLKKMLIVLASGASLIAIAWAASKVLNRLSLGILNLAVTALALAVVLKALPDIVVALGKAISKIGDAFKVLATAS